jgi:hypothetical protein
MSETSRKRSSCPHCGRPVRLTWSQLLPPRDNKRVLTCESCGGHFDLANSTKMTAVATGMVGMILAMLGPFQWIVKAGGGSRPALFGGLLVSIGIVALAAMTASRLTLNLERKP